MLHPDSQKTGVTLQATQLWFGETSMSVPSETATAIGERLARLRKERGITQKELATRLELTQPMVSEYERGTLRLHGETILLIAGILDVTADELLGREGEAQVNENTTKSRRLIRRLNQLSKLPKRDQDAVLRTIDAFLAKAS